MGIDFLLLAENAHWVWLSLGGLLLAAEMLGGCGYLLWSGVSAVIVGLLTWGVPLPWPWPWQGVLFAVLTLITAFLWWYWLRKRSPKTDGKVLNQRSRQLIGVRATITEAVVDGVGRARIGDSTWRVKADQPLQIGTTVEVMAVDGITLSVRVVTQ